MRISIYEINAGVARERLLDVINRSRDRLSQVIHGGGGATSRGLVRRNVKFTKAVIDRREARVKGTRDRAALVLVDQQVGLITGVRD